MRSTEIITVIEHLSFMVLQITIQDNLGSGIWTFEEDVVDGQIECDIKNVYMASKTSQKIVAK